ncbi:MAG: phosphopantetheine-binding protein, partial [Acidobacteriota bacterium]
IERAAVAESFFDLGGHSLLATLLTSRIRDQFEVEVPLRRIFDTPTLGEMALVVSQLMLDADEGMVHGDEAELALMAMHDQRQGEGVS